MLVFFQFVGNVNYEAMCLPDLDACIAENLQCGPDISLELVLYSSQTQQLHLHLQTLNHCGHLQRTIMDAQLGLDVPSLGSRRGKGMFSMGGDKLE